MHRECTTNQRPTRSDGKNLTVEVRGLVMQGWDETSRGLELLGLGQRQGPKLVLSRMGLLPRFSLMTYHR